MMERTRTRRRKPAPFRKVQEGTAAFNAWFAGSPRKRLPRVRKKQILFYKETARQMQDEWATFLKKFQSDI